MRSSMSKLRKMLCSELDEIASKPELSAGDLETLDKLTDTIKNIDKIEMLDQGGDYSQRGDWETRIKGNSYKTRKTSKMADKLERLLEECQTSKERDAICDCIDRIKEE